MWGLHTWFRQHAHLTTALTPRQAVFINITSLMTSPYLLLVTGSLRSNLSRAKCTAQVGMSYRLRSVFKLMGCWLTTEAIKYLYSCLVWASGGILQSKSREWKKNQNGRVLSFSCTCWLIFSFLLVFHTSRPVFLHGICASKLRRTRCPQ